MDGRRFDTFVVALGRTTTRRQWFKTCAAGLAAAALGRTGLGARAQDDPAIEQNDPNAAPLPNFPFLVAVPTDSRYAAYAVDDRLTGPPTRYRSLDAMTDLSDEWRSALSNGFQSAYVATIARAGDGDPDAPDRAVTTVVYDLGSEEDAERARDDYISVLFDDPAISEVESDSSGPGGVVLGGCDGGCEFFSNPVESSEGAVNEMAVVGSFGQFVFDARLRRFSDEEINPAEGDAVARLITSRLSGVTSLTGGASAARGTGTALLRRLTKAFRPNAAPAMRAQASTDDLRDGLASRNSLPIFDTGAGDPPLTATQTLIVDDGAIVVRFGESPASAAARQRSAEDVVFACGTDQELPLDEPYHDGYDLTLSNVQYVFLNEGDAEEFLAESRERMRRDRPRIDLNEVDTNDDQIVDVYQDGQEDDGYRYGCITHRILRLGAVTAVLSTDLFARPRTDEEDEIDLDDIEDELCPLVDESTDVFINCIATPDECQSAFRLSLPNAEPTPTPTPDCNQGQTRCNGQCINTSSDPNNCGACGNVCPQGEFCANGQCGCPAGYTDCGNYCADLAADPSNCGDCGRACGQNEYCSSSECLCTSGQPRCGDICCGPNQACDDDECSESCDGILCDGDCVDPSSDIDNCGDCGIHCSIGGCCSGFCVDHDVDPNHCGGCFNGCGGGTCCFGSCTDTSSDPFNCGSCGNSCGSGMSCCFGTYCADTNFDPENCGSCGNSCSGGDCYNGQCG